VERCGLRAEIGNNSPRQILCSSLSDVGSPSDTDHPSSETFLNGQEPIPRILAGKQTQHFEHCFRAQLAMNMRLL
jgi:hypothetical protein